MYIVTVLIQGFPCGLAGKESICNVGDPGSIPWLGRSPGEGNSYRLQYGLPGGSASKASAFTVGSWVQYLGQEDLLEKEMATHSSILA